MATIYVPSASGWQQSNGYPYYIRLAVTQTYNSATDTSTLSIMPQFYGTTGSLATFNGSYIKLDNAELTPSIDGQSFQANYSTQWIDMRSNAYTKSVTHGTNGATKNVSVSVYFAISGLPSSGRTFSGEAALALTGTPSYTLSINAGTGCGITVKRNGATLANGATVYRGDSLVVSAAASTGYATPTLKVNGTTFSSGGTHTVAGAVTVTATTSVLSYTLSTSATNSTITVNRTSSPLKGASTGNISSGSAVYYGDVLKISATAATNYTLTSLTVNSSSFANGGSHTVVGNVTVAASASLAYANPTVGTPAASVVDLTGNFPSTYISGYSKVKVAAAVTAGPNATISNVKMSYPAGTTVTMTYNSGTGKYEGTTSAPISGNVTITVTATDTNGRTGSNAVSVTGVVSYTAPTISIDTSKTYRCDPGGTKTSGGTHYRAKATANYYSSLSGNTIITFNVKIGSGTATALTSGTQSGAIAGTTNPLIRYTLIFTVQDKVSEAVTREYVLDGMLRNLVLRRSTDGTYVGVGTTPAHSSGASTIELPIGGAYYIGEKPIRDTLNLGVADGIVEDGGDLNSFISPGVFQVDSSYTIANKPSGAGGGIVRVWIANGQAPRADGKWFFVLQAYIDIDGNEWRRRGNSGSSTTFTWQSWRQLQFV